MRWIVVDGIDGSGKSTVAAWIRDHYAAQGDKVVIMTHPSEAWTGKASRRFLESQGKAARLMATVFFIVDVLGSVRNLKKLERTSATVIFVRYLMATAYLPERLAPKGYDFFCKILPVPRRLLLVDTRPEVALGRIESRNETKEMFEDLGSLERIRRKVLMLAERKGWKVLDNSGPEKESKPALERILAAWDKEAD
jgi:dTMP kinase